MTARWLLALVGVACTPPAAHGRLTEPSDARAAPVAQRSVGDGGLELAPDARRWVVLGALDVDAPLFGDELARVGDAARGAIDRTPGLRSVPRGETERLASLAASGRASEGGPVCAARPSLAELLERTHPGALFARLTLDCIGETCFLGVDVENELELVVRVDAAHDVTAWERAFDGQRLSPLRAAPLRPPSGPVDEAGPWMVSRALAFGDFARLPQRASLSTKDLAACGGGPRSTLLVSVAPSGEVQRCERLDGDIDTACACQSVSKQRFGEAAGARRLTLHLARSASAAALQARVAPAPPAPLFVTTDLDEPPARRMDHARALQSCVSPTTRKGKLEAEVALDASGHVERAELRPDDLLTATERDCLSRGLRDLRFACPVTGAGRVKLALRIGP